MNIDDTTLASYGITVSDEDKPEFFKQLSENLEELVGYAIMEKLNDEDAQELMNLTKAGDQQAVAAWLQTHLPEYQQITEAELDRLLKEVAEVQAKEAK